MNANDRFENDRFVIDELTAEPTYSLDELFNAPTVDDLYKKYRETLDDCLCVYDDEEEVEMRAYVKDYERYRSYQDALNDPLALYDEAEKEEMRDYIDAFETTAFDEPRAPLC